MVEQTITSEELLRDIYQAEAQLRWFEQKYGLLSETFYRLLQEGQLRDEDPVEIQEYMEWAGWFEIYQDRRQRYERAIDEHLKLIAVPASLPDLHITQLQIPA
ncbi:MAG: hypothetical protein R3C14_05515 [Caldilineaceae bacterium]